MTYSPELISYMEVNASLSAAGGTSRQSYRKNHEPAACSRLYQSGPSAFDIAKTKALGTCNLVPRGLHVEKVKQTKDEDWWLIYVALRWEQQNSKFNTVLKKILQSLLSTYLHRRQEQATNKISNLF